MVTRRCLFLDRDGVINVKPAEGEYVRNWSEFHFLPAIADWIRLFRALDFLVIVLTNQRGVARGLIRPDDLEEIHSKMRQELDREEAHIDDVFCCPHAEGACNCRKPKPGLVWEAEQRWKIDLSSSLLIGDSDSDRQLAATCGMAFAMARNGRIVETHPGKSALLL
jgi:histidinol-phosphate phosphatase family protein